MAILSGDKKSVTVQKNDTLWGIAEDYLGSGTKYQQLASINNIKSPYIIYVGQVIKLTKNGSSSSKKSNSSNKAAITGFGLQSNADNTLYATWTWSKSNTENYEYQWLYDSGDGVWFIGSDSTTEHKQCTYGYPSNAKRVAFKVKPISKTYTNDNKTTSYWTAEWSTTKYYDVANNPPKQPPTPSTVEIKNLKLTVTLDNLDVNADSIQFQIVKDNSTIFKTGTAAIKTNHASYSCAVTAGSEYKVRCRSVKGKVYSSWSDYSSNYDSGPAASSGITLLKALDDTKIRIEWAAVKNADSYEVEYTTKTIYFDTSTDVTTTTVDASVGHQTIISVETGKEYFFRVRAVKGSEQKSAWTEIKSISIGKKPIAPTTWSSTTTVIIGEPLTLYWVHNAQDGSSQTFAELELVIDGFKETHTIENTRSEEEKDETSTYTIDTTETEFSEGSKIKWRVRTAGVTKQYGDWSVQRTVDIYAPPTLELRVTDIDGNDIETLTSFPFYIYGLTGPNTQSPIGYHLTISANEIYETIDNVGNPKIVNKGEQVYSKYFDIADVLLVEMSAGNVDLENNISYIVNCTACMNSGLTAESSCDLSVTWADLEIDVNAEVNIDPETITASIRPYCETYEDGYYKVELGENTYEVTTETVDISLIDNVYTTSGEIVYIGSTGQGLYYCEVCADNNGNPINPVYHTVVNNGGKFVITTSVLDPDLIKEIYTTTGERVLLGTDENGSVIHYCLTENRSPLEGVKLSVYRREFDGSFTELATGIDNTKQTFITDPHPALDYARYRIVGILEDTGAVSYVDLPGIPVGEKAIIMQWDEEWSNFDVTNEDEMEQPAWSGSLLKLPYNVDVSDNNNRDVSLVEYIGRKRPVSYYGTQIGENATWNTEFDKRDEETLYTLRRLAIWMGDVYVREPSGSGYWANVSVAYSQKHCELTIPVTFTITRVEGGV